ncbi:hypothetical protein [Bartonella sp. LJL80]
MTEKIRLEPLALLNEESWLAEKLKERVRLLSHFRFVAEQERDAAVAKSEQLEEENAHLRSEVKRLTPEAEVINGL